MPIDTVAYTKRVSRIPQGRPFGRPVGYPGLIRQAITRKPEVIRLHGAIQQHTSKYTSQVQTQIAHSTWLDAPYRHPVSKHRDTHTSVWCYLQCYKMALDYTYNAGAAQQASIGPTPGQTYPLTVDRWGGNSGRGGRATGSEKGPRKIWKPQLVEAHIAKLVVTQPYMGPRRSAGHRLLWTENPNIHKWQQNHNAPL